MHGTDHVDSNACNIADCEMCPPGICIFWECVGLGVIDGFGPDQSLRVYTNRKFCFLYRLSLKVTKFGEEEGIFHVHERTTFSSDKRYLAAKVPLGLDWFVVNGLEWVPYTR